MTTIFLSTFTFSMQAITCSKSVLPATLCIIFGKSLFIREPLPAVKITTLNAFIPFLFTKHIALIKIDVEGHEFEVFEGGKELITKYHVPFIKLEFEVRMIEAHRNNAFEFLQFFENNGYKISLKDFFSKEYISSTELAKSKGNNNLYIVYEKILE